MSDERREPHGCGGMKDAVGAGFIVETREGARLADLVVRGREGSQHEN